MRLTLRAMGVPVVLAYPLQATETTRGDSEWAPITIVVMLFAVACTIVILVVTLFYDPQDVFLIFG